MLGLEYRFGLEACFSPLRLDIFKARGDSDVDFNCPCSRGASLIYSGEM